MTAHPHPIAAAAARGSVHFSTSRTCMGPRKSTTPCADSRVVAVQAACEKLQRLETGFSLDTFNGFETRRLQAMVVNWILNLYSPTAWRGPRPTCAAAAGATPSSRAPPPGPAARRRARRPRPTSRVGTSHFILQVKTPVDDSQPYDVVPMM
jgi:hypothetical protein